MARIARVVVAGFPHHVTQRGNRRQPTFFLNEDFQVYKAILAETSQEQGVECWAYCLMTNHVHLILVPGSQDSLRGVLGEAHRRYTRRINFREGWRGHLWQERFSSYVMDEEHLIAAARYVELNPVQARMTTDPGSYPWSSAKAHLEARDDGLVHVKPLLDLVPDWKTLLQGGVSEIEAKRLEHSGRTGRPLGSERFIQDLEARLGRTLQLRKRGPKPKMVK